MQKSSSKSHRARGPRRTSHARRPATAPSEQFWAELLDTLKALRADVQRLAGVGVVPEDEPRRTKHLDWSRFEESRQAAAEGRERYWREMGSPAAGR